MFQQAIEKKCQLLKTGKQFKNVKHSILKIQMNIN